MSENIIGTSSYSEAMDLSDLDDCGYDQESTASPEATVAPEPGPAASSADTPPIKIRKKPGRKPNPASPALRKAQNRAAQRAFRERKERHMKDLETNIRGIREHRDKLLRENETMSTENEILKAENWYLKGIVLSLQLVCLQHNLVIPQHCPHIDEKTLGILNQSIPDTIAAYINVNSKNKLQISTRLMNDSPEISNIQLQQQQHQERMKQQYQQQQTSVHDPLRSVLQFQTQPIPQQLPQGSLIVTRDGIQKVADKHTPPANSWYHNTNKDSQQPIYDQKQPSPAAEDNSQYNVPPPLSPMSASDQEKLNSNTTNKSNMFGTDHGGELPRPVLLADEPVSSNLAAIQTLRLRLRLQSACVRMESIPFAIQPTLLQLTIPHDPRIDLIPTPHMRDRMILYRDQFDLDDCFRCLLAGSVFHGGDPAIAGNWQLPSEFFEKYWFLTIDYNLRRYTNEWRKLQGLKEINTNTATIPNEKQQLHPQTPGFHPSPNTTNTTTNNTGLSYQDLSSYLGVQIDSKQQQQQHQQQQQQQQQQQNQQQQQQQQQNQQQDSSMLTPIQLMNGYGILNTAAGETQKSKPAAPPLPPTQSSSSSPSPWDNILMGQKNYDMMMTGMYNNNSEMDQRPH
ncbi:uncharacterized protein EV154DRAFT_606869 [Mucor mucedo]|uniref:uncharacterized protein n=1 Tax=Mucor mucedo TaxID=29922 RepID=UPI0022212157|nr:uncharacterized protein EV154DRAFT_606869 [Mucor mucedo]KAI7875269.1 hypothetical protein EV154DRAFT_606869 [Mucor mucedo]